MSYKPPKFKAASFNCPHCGAYAHMAWTELLYRAFEPSEQVCGKPKLIGHRSTGAHMSVCSCCSSRSFWLTMNVSASGQELSIMLYPARTKAPDAHPDMPASVKEDYDEARKIVEHSPRAAAALLRLAIEKLCHELGENHQLNISIGNLVSQGMPVQIQQALDIVRVVGNNAIHPGAIDKNDVKEIADKLFELVNIIVEDRITRPKEIDYLFNNLPLGAIEGIEKRDNDKK